jgi:hypothetical protein
MKRSDWGIVSVKVAIIDKENNVERKRIQRTVDG